MSDEVNKDWKLISYFSDPLSNAQRKTTLVQYVLSRPGILTGRARSSDPENGENQAWRFPFTFVNEAEKVTMPSEA